MLGDIEATSRLRPFSDQLTYPYDLHTVFISQAQIYKMHPISPLPAIAVDLVPKS